MKVGGLLLGTAMALSVMAISSAQPFDTTASSRDSADFLVAAQYEEDVLPLLQRKCTACHLQSANRPFFYHLLGRWSRAYVDNKIERALASFEILPSLMDVDDESASRYATKIQRVLKEGRMPPAPYLVLHPNHQVTDAERLTISKWAELESEQ